MHELEPKTAHLVSWKKWPTLKTRANQKTKSKEIKE